MRSFCTSGLALSLGLLWSAGAMAQGYGSPSLLPMPEAGPQLSTSPASYSAALANSPYRSTLSNHQPALADDGRLPPPPGQDNMRSGAMASADSGEGSPCGNWSDDCCGDCCCGPTWFVSSNALILNRDTPNRFWTTFETNNNPNQLMNTKDADADWAGGAEIRVGRWCCPDCSGRSGWEVVYYGIKLDGFASLRDPGNDLSTPINLDTQTGPFLIGARPAADFFDSAREHRIFRDNEIHNIEVNFLRETLISNQSTQVTWLAGFRYFRFDESVIFGSVAGDAAITPGGAEFGNNGGVDEAYLDIRCENNLVGFQVGARGDYYCTDDVSLFLAPKLGVYGNEINSRSRLYTGSGISAFDIESNEDDFSFLAQVDLGASYQFAPHWRLFGGYRAIAVSGIALADNQFPAFIAAADEFADIDTNGDLILHGAFLGLELNY